MSTFKLYNEKTAQTPTHVLFNQKKKKMPQQWPFTSMEEEA